MYASATCSTSDFHPQTLKRFDSGKFRDIPTSMPFCRNSVAFEFRVIPLEHVCFCYLFYIRLSSANGKALTRLSSAKQKALTRMYASATCSTSDFHPQTAKGFDSTFIRKRFDSVSFADIPTSMRFAEIQLPLNFG
ncbi:hypothetical protein D5086_027237 [Populus alba]|uniref:Uncharacterized protein n=1 Tax=Populus alba TaxID=43335 RepID=A0ACC4AW48_POPAL